jgi:hypothetical protein
MTGTKTGHGPMPRKSPKNIKKDKNCTIVRGVWNLRIKDFTREALGASFLTEGWASVFFMVSSLRDDYFCLNVKGFVNSLMFAFAF